MIDFIPQTINYSVVERKNVHVKGNKEWAFNIQFRMLNSTWTIFTWPYEPSEEEIKNVLEITLRSISVFYRNLQFPTLNLEAKRIQ
jgi:hypothetical protein